MEITNCALSSSTRWRTCEFGIREENSSCWSGTSHKQLKHPKNTIDFKINQMLPLYINWGTYLMKVQSSTVFGYYIQM